MFHWEFEDLIGSWTSWTLETIQGISLNTEKNAQANPIGRNGCTWQSFLYNKPRDETAKSCESALVSTSSLPQSGWTFNINMYVWTPGTARQAKVISAGEPWLQWVQRVHSVELWRFQVHFGIFGQHARHDFQTELRYRDLNTWLKQWLDLNI